MKKAIQFSSYVVFTLICFFTGAKAQHNIEVQLTNYEDTEIFLGYHLGDKQYLKDTVSLGKDGTFIFQGEEDLPPGVYLIVLKPDNQFFEIIVSKEDQRFKVFANVADLTKDVLVENSNENLIFNSYKEFLAKKRIEVKPINEEIEQKRTAGESTESLQAKLKVIDAEVKALQKDVMEKYPDSYTAALIRSSIDITLPDFTDIPQEKRQFAQYRYYKNHYFDNIDLQDERLLRSPVLHSKVKFYMDKLTMQHPDSISVSLSFFLDKMYGSETFKYYLVESLNEYAGSKIAGYDAVYVYLIDTYYRTGKADWTDEENLNKMLENASKLKPLLIGKPAPPITTYKKNGEAVSLYDIKSPYTIILFWAYDCGHCKKSMPALVEFYEEYKDKGVVIYSVCSKLMDSEPDCWPFVEEKGMEKFINTTDKYMRSKFKSKYDIRSTPKLFILDENKKILMKGIGSEQLGELMPQLMEIEENKKKNNG